MKKLMFFGLLVLASCTSLHYTMGMSETDFLNKNHSASVESQTASSSVYRVHYHTGKGEGTEFFYFQDGVLVQVDKGIRRPDITIDQTIHQ